MWLRSFPFSIVAAVISSGNPFDGQTNTILGPVHADSKRYGTALHTFGVLFSVVAAVEILLVDRPIPS